MRWFEVDKSGLAKILARRGKEFVLFELIQNAWDELTTKVSVQLTRINGTRNVRLVVEDDNPEGFADLNHAFTLFAESTKKGDVSKRGRFNLGEKLVLALCEMAEIASTKGTILFDSNGRQTKRAKRQSGTVFTGIIRMTNTELDECSLAVQRLIPPPNIKTTFNGKVLERPSRIKEIQQVSLPTEIADDDGHLRRTTRNTTVEVFEVRPGDRATIYEMGIPIVETGDRFHVNIQQKVPLNLDRDNVTPAYLAQVRAIVLPVVIECLTVADANARWVKDAVENHGDKLPDTTIDKLVTLRFGDKRVSFDVSDPEANKLAVSKGYAVVHGGQLSGAEWDAVRRTGSILPAGRVTPSPKPFSPDGRPMTFVHEADWTEPMSKAVAYIRRIALRLLKAPVMVSITNDRKWPFAAAYGKGDLILNLGRLGHNWFMDRRRINELMIHEFGHHFSGDHLSEDFHDALCSLGSTLAEIAMEDPHLLQLDK